MAAAIYAATFFLKIQFNSLRILSQCEFFVRIRISPVFFHFPVKLFSVKHGDVRSDHFFGSRQKQRRWALQDAAPGAAVGKGDYFLLVMVRITTLPICFMPLIMVLILAFS